VFKTWQERGGVAETSLTLHAAPEAATNRYAFKSALREIELPNPDFSSARCLQGSRARVE